jgi:hypothetical protein
MVQHLIQHCLAWIGNLITRNNQLEDKENDIESGEYRFIVPLDPSEGERFVEPTCLDLEEINQLYRTTA